MRIGFVRWGEDVAQQVSEDGFYKTSEGFVVEKRGDRSNLYLAMPNMRRDPRVEPAWNAIQFREAPALIPAEVIGWGSGATANQPVMAATGMPLTDVRRATLPDFVDYYDASLMNPKVLVGVFLGAMSTFVFCAMTMKAVGRAARGMVEEVRRQFREKPGIMEGKDLPDYARPVAISTKAAQWEMIAPSLLGLVTPIIVGLLLGVGGVLGLLVGVLTTGFCVAVFMANAGGAWDNAKKHIEAGHHGGKGSEAHKAGVVGDTVGDPFKDTSGPSLNILIKLMSMVSVVAAGLIVRYSLMALGYF